MSVGIKKIKVKPETWWSNRHALFVKLAIAAFILVVFLDLPTLCQSHDHHDHHHHHTDESPSFKYSKQANENVEKSHKHHHDHDHEHHHHEHKDTPKNNEEKSSVLLKAMGSTLLISAAPFVLLFFVPLDNSKEREPLLKVLLSFASGGLLGDAFLHLIPHALAPHSHGDHGSHDDHHHSHNHGEEEHSHGHDMSVGLCVLLGIIVFLIVEKAIRLIKGDHGHSHSVKPNDKNNKNSKTNNKDNKKEEIEDIKISGYLNLAADFLHNFTDGLAIGASYLAGDGVGYITTFTILLHEVPHEIGDFAILIQSGCSKKKAIWLQLSTAIGALCGTYVALLAEGMDAVVTSWILPFTAGGFIYIATVTVIPELLSDTKFWQSVKEVIALLLGVYMMVLIAQYE
ncbi:hypothetical protein HCN44_009138 [Aphidius gifuensis]|uniref:Uncharacterized protein n=1 Tax=Aphidius gifuensis TaxID=684658 RepID=A0A834Y1R6_APHGI|nr:protein catecholamines up [Aphidius gifuensis]KAF7997740.1 hypothetical protein HCN44_009138 [Aphidius gifuensis]